MLKASVQPGQPGFCPRICVGATPPVRLQAEPDTRVDRDPSNAWRRDHRNIVNIERSPNATSRMAHRHNGGFGASCSVPGSGGGEVDGGGSSRTIGASPKNESGFAFLVGLVLPLEVSGAALGVSESGPVGDGTVLSGSWPNRNAPAGMLRRPQLGHTLSPSGISAPQFLHLRIG